MRLTTQYPKIYMHCIHCGSDDVSATGEITWDDEHQRLNVHEAWDWWCGTCESTTFVEDIYTVQLELFKYELSPETGVRWFDFYQEEFTENEWNK